MIRDTSINAYHEIESRGLLSERRMEAYRLLFNHGPCTAMELRSLMPKGVVDSQIRARLNELRKLGVAKEIGTKRCSITSMEVIIWDVTSHIPTKILKDRPQLCLMCGQPIRRNRVRPAPVDVCEDPSPHHEPSQ